MASYYQINTEWLSAITSYAWPGNIRELRHAIERAIILSQSETLQPSDFQLETLVQVEQTTAGQQQVNQEAVMGLPSELNLVHLEKQPISQALKTHRYNISHTAKALGLTRAALYRRMEKHGL